VSWRHPPATEPPTVAHSGSADSVYTFVANATRDSAVSSCERVNSVNASIREYSHSSVLRCVALRRGNTLGRFVQWTSSCQLSLTLPVNMTVRAVHQWQSQVLLSLATFACIGYLLFSISGKILICPWQSPWRGECRPPLNKSTCWACWSALGTIPGYYLVLRPPNLPAFAWRADGDISAEVFSMSEPSAWRSFVETATSIHGLATRWW